MKAELRKQDILKNYYHIILKEGVEGASIAKIAKRMKVNPSLLIHYFETKDNLTIELVKYISLKYNKLFKKVDIETNDAVKRLDKLCDLLISETWYKNTDISGDISIISVSFRDKKIFTHLETLYNEFIYLIKSEIEQANASGKVEIKNPQEKAEIIISVIQGFRYFQHFFIDKAKSEKYKKNMKKLLLSIIYSD